MIDEPTQKGGKMSEQEKKDVSEQPHEKDHEEGEVDAFYSL